MLTVTLHMVMSLDGYIAAADNNLSWFETTCAYPKGEDYGDPAPVMDAIDAYIMGANTYALAVDLAAKYGWPYGNKPLIVITHRQPKPFHDKVEWFAGELGKLIHEQLASRFNTVWVVGGSGLAQAFLRQQLVQAIQVSVLPILLGNGLPLFSPGYPTQALQLKAAKAYKNGSLLLNYELLR